MSGRREDFRSVVPFINAVRARQCLWNSSITAYTKKDLTSAAWKEIAEEFKDNEHNCRDRWKNIRTAFVRSMKPPKSGSGKSFKRTYYLSEHLSFLLPFVKSKVSCKLEDDSVDESSANIDEDDEVMSAEETPEQPSSMVEIVENPIPEVKQTYKQEEKTEAVYNKEWMDTEKEIRRKERDADELFLLSLLPDIGKLSGQRKRSFKVETMSLLNKLLDEDERGALGSSHN